MKKFFSKFLKDTRGVVMMEYIVLGIACVAMTLVGVLVLSKTYNNGFIIMSYGTIAKSNAVIGAVNAAAGDIAAQAAKVDTYANALNADAAGVTITTYSVFEEAAAPAPGGSTTP